MDDSDESAESGGNFKPDSTDRKKQTHLRCERQRREAINSGYADLRRLIPTSMAPLGCKTTNASILYRTSDYIRQLEAELESVSTEASKAAQQAEALEIISAQYEELAAEQGSESQQTPSSLTPLRLQMFIRLTEAWYGSFEKGVKTESYPALTKSLLSWLETVNPQESAQALLN